MFPRLEPGSVVVIVVIGDDLDHACVTEIHAAWMAGIDETTRAVRILTFNRIASPSADCHVNLHHPLVIRTKDLCR
jgi:hypothetical protein